ncbi:hypothetical protein B0H19DRAFT_1206055 [Mycena capillaripes]|nr:hypothetical protein B0H19DRAFT_1206055 [Mycena capillaripes]
MTERTNGPGALNKCVRLLYLGGGDGRHGQSRKRTNSGTPDSLFGPNIGPVQQGPAWTTHTQPKRLVEPDELTTDTVRAWIEKSKIPTTPTTTLQALVNLRRPTLKLSPLAPADGVTLKDAPHLLEFQFDCAAPKCGVHVHVLLPPAHPDAPAHGGALRVFEAVVEGGFARALGPADAAVIELAHFERVPPASAAIPAAAATSAPSSAAPATSAAAPERKRFTPFHFRRRNASTNVPAATPVAGAALAVVEGDSSNSAKEGDGSVAGDGDDGKGVRVTIRLVALDAAGRELDSPNEQTVYLVVGRLGAAPAAAAASGSDAPAEDATKDANAKEGEADKDKDADTDTRPWLVRVVKREATIGPHTFQLHEIYGLSSAAAPADDPPERECLLCLSAPREVVLLPCRHLVACRPCAVNMVEFGAGGAIVADAGAGGGGEAEEAPAPTTTAANPTTAATESPTEAVDGTSPVEGAEASPAEGEGATANASPVPAATTTTSPAAAATPAPAPMTTRRKRKAKGWFCPVCRQPYTSLLRITTAPPPAGAAVAAASASPVAPAVGGAGVGANGGTGAGAGEEGGSGSGGGLLSGLRPPAFLRGLSMRGERAAPRDVEAQL